MVGVFPEDEIKSFTKSTLWYPERSKSSINVVLFHGCKKFTVKVKSETEEL